MLKIQAQASKEKEIEYAFLALTKVSEVLAYMSLCLTDVKAKLVSHGCVFRVTTRCWMPRR